MVTVNTSYSLIATRSDPHSQTRPFPTKQFMAWRSSWRHFFYKQTRVKVFLRKARVSPAQAHHFCARGKRVHGSARKTADSI